ncbi:MAG TPA: hypothetical protein PKA64_08060 [Myxococcota bacterium]|nr:hypothetical protein [Myxococcota bacterium]
MSSDTAPASAVVTADSRVVVAALLAVAGVIGLLTPPGDAAPTWIAVELALTIAGLFVFGSTRIRVDKNALTFGMLSVITATFVTWWWPRSSVQAAWPEQGAAAWWPVIQRWLLSWHGLEELIHADTMLFILGLAVLVALIAETRLLESIALGLLSRFRGRLLPTVITLTGVVAVVSGIIGGVAMIGLLIRTLSILLFLVNADQGARRYSVVVATIITTVCGMWLAYGEPPNLIMAANLTGDDGRTLLTDRFFVTWCMPMAAASFLVVSRSLAARLGDLRVDTAQIDVLEAEAATFRFLQAERHGQVYTAVEVVEDHEAELGAAAPVILEHLGRGESLGEAMVRCGVDPALRVRLLGVLTHEDIAPPLDLHFQERVANPGAPLPRQVAELIAREGGKRVRTQKVALFALAVFLVLLVTHAFDHRVPLFLPPFTGAAIAWWGISSYSRMVRLALHNAAEEYQEYFFLFPLFSSVSLLTRTGFFDVLQDHLLHAIQTSGVASVALVQFVGSTVLSAVLDNNVVADFASRALHNLEMHLVYLFSAAQIAGYGLGGCWTHVGSAQSIVAYAFIRRDLDETYTPGQWVGDITPLILQLSVVLAAMIAGMAWIAV